MKVGIITFHRARNYGAVLQAYALMTYINNNFDGVEAELIDYRCKYIEDFYEPVIRMRRPKQFILDVLSKNRIVKRNECFQEFVDSAIKVSTPCDRTNIKSQPYDRYIAGSDMIWHWHTTEDGEFFDDAYFLDFVTDDSKKFSYAASFGTEDLPEKYLEHYRKVLSGFNAISVREKSGIKQVKDLTGKDAECNIDPTLLFGGNEWRKIAVKPSEQKYVLLYEVGGISQELRSAADQIAAQKGCKVITLFSEYNPIQYARTKNGIFGFSPREFLGWIDNAECVLTNSFHGTVFSIIFHKQFLSEINAWSKNNRSFELMKAVKLENRTLENSNLRIDDSIDWSEVDSRLNEERKKSYKVIENIVRQ